MLPWVALARRSGSWGKERKSARGAPRSADGGRKKMRRMAGKAGSRGGGKRNEREREGLTCVGAVGGGGMRMRGRTGTREICESKGAAGSTSEVRRKQAIDGWIEGRDKESASARSDSIPSSPSLFSVFS
jgi:hypothetical protein